MDEMIQSFFLSFFRSCFPRFGSLQDDGDDDRVILQKSNRFKDMRKGYLKWITSFRNPLRIFFLGKKLVTLPTQANCETIELFMSDRYFNRLVYGDPYIGFL